jgi:WD40 repeat protein
MRNKRPNHLGLLLLVTGALALPCSASARQAAQVGTLDGHTDAVYALGWAPDGRSIITASFDGSVRVWDASTRKELRRCDGHDGIVIAVAPGPDGQRFASGGVLS